MTVPGNGHRLPGFRSESKRIAPPEWLQNPTAGHWYLMIGKNPLWGTQQNGRSVQTRLDTYAAWTGGAQESDVEALRRARAGAPDRVPQSPPAVNSDAASVSLEEPKSPLKAPEFGSRLTVDHPTNRVSVCSTKRKISGREGSTSRRKALNIITITGRPNFRTNISYHQTQSQAQASLRR